MPTKRPQWRPDSDHNSSPSRYPNDLPPAVQSQMSPDVRGALDDGLVCVASGGADWVIRLFLFVRENLAVQESRPWRRFVPLRHR
ncbi:protein of unknown function [Rhodovastum atsumiense]|nr:protein of unknown function [Rhodovastum atsumiense]